MSTTSKLFSYGDVDDRGFIFQCYRKNRNKGKLGTRLEWWLSPESYKKHRIQIAQKSARTRSKKSGVPFSITPAYLVSIFPVDGKCPALGIPLKWGVGCGPGGNFDSPALDRIVPELGYVEGNVIWVCHLANTIKTSATAEQIAAVGRFYLNLKH